METIIEQSMSQEDMKQFLNTPEAISLYSLYELINPDTSKANQEIEIALLQQKSPNLIMAINEENILKAEELIRSVEKNVQKFVKNLDNLPENLDKLRFEDVYKKYKALKYVVTIHRNQDTLQTRTLKTPTWTEGKLNSLYQETYGGLSSAETAQTLKAENKTLELIDQILTSQISLPSPFDKVDLNRMKEKIEFFYQGYPEAEPQENLDGKYLEPLRKYVIGDISETILKFAKGEEFLPEGIIKFIPKVELAKIVSVICEKFGLSIEINKSENIFFDSEVNIVNADKNNQNSFNGVLYAEYPQKAPFFKLNKIQPTHISNIETIEIVNKVIEEIYKQLENQDIFKNIKDDWEAVLHPDPKNKTLSADQSSREIKVPHENRESVKIITAVFHELLVHAFRRISADNLGLPATSPGYEQHEEGLATAFESAVLNEKEFKVTGSPYQLIATLNNLGLEFNEIVAFLFLKKQGKIENIQKLSEASQEDVWAEIKKNLAPIRRMFRGTSDNSGIFPKDLMYQRGKQLLAKFLQKIYDLEERENGLEEDELTILKFARFMLDWKNLLVGKYAFLDSKEVGILIKTGYIKLPPELNGKENIYLDFLTNLQP
jgi:hypothetical protein